MKALFVVCRSTLEAEVRDCLRSVHVAALTEIGQVSGIGAAGTAPSAWEPPNVLIFVVLSGEQVAEVTHSLGDLVARLKPSYEGHAVPLRVFGMPCESLV